MIAFKTYLPDTLGKHLRHLPKVFGVVLMLLFGSVYAQELNLGVKYSVYGGSSVEAGTGYAFTYKTRGLMASVDYSTPNHTVLGQGAGQIGNLCLGLGTYSDLTTKVQVYGVIARCLTEHTAPKIQEAEFVTQTFRNNFTVEPWWPFGDPLNYDHEEYTLDSSSWKITLGLAFQMYRNLYLDVGYSFHSIGQNYVAWNGERPTTTAGEDTCNCLHLYNTELDLSHGFVTISYRF